MGKIIGTTLNEGSRIIVAQEPEKLHKELLRESMEEKNINPEKLANKISMNSLNSNTHASKRSVSAETIKSHLNGNRGQKRPPKPNDPIIMSMAEALEKEPIELVADTKREERAWENFVHEHDEIDDWHDTLCEIGEKLEKLELSQCNFLLKHYKILTSIPELACELIKRYNTFNDEDKLQFNGYFSELIQSTKPTNVKSQILTNLKLIAELDPQVYSESFDEDIHERLMGIFPSVNQSEETYCFLRDLDLFITLDKERFLIIIDYLSLDNKKRQEMIVRIADQMYIVSTQQ